ncbi:MAG: hypothetical protein methR_P3275 [Methyloprofundus sp.]|nr:MAG: hypothetical protein methR_P3275 [Methyloprofundus sp.]
MASSAGRRSFLLGITLNELSFIMFFLLMLVSTATLQKTKQELADELEHTATLAAEIVNIKQSNEENFKRLQLLESSLMHAGGYAVPPTQTQLNQLFSKLSAASNTDSLTQTTAELQRQLQAYQQLSKELEKQGLATDSASAIEQLLAQIQATQLEQQSLQGQVAYLQKKLKGNGLDHPPCWADAHTGAVEYLYAITLYEKQMHITAAWPKHRLTDLQSIPSARNLAGKTLTQAQLAQQVQPIFAWSKAHNCRHFVRIKDDQATSKAAFKQQMLAIEAYFYKYLQR